MTSNATQIWLLDEDGRVVASTSTPTDGKETEPPSDRGAAVPLNNGWLAIVRFDDAHARDDAATASADLSEELRSAHEALASQAETLGADSSGWEELSRQLLIANLELQTSNQDLERRVRSLERRKKTAKSK